MRFVSRPRGPRISSGYARMAPATLSSMRVNAVAIASSGRANVTTPQPSIAVATGSDPASACDLGQHRLLARMLGEPVALERPALARQRASIPACFPEQLCLSFGALERAALEVVLRGRSLVEERLHGRELRLVGQVRGRGDREVALVQVGALPGQGKRPGSASPRSA